MKAGRDVGRSQQQCNVLHIDRICPGTPEYTQSLRRRLLSVGRLPQHPVSRELRITLEVSHARRFFSTVFYIVAENCLHIRLPFPVRIHCIALAVLVWLASAAAAQVSVLTQHNDNGRSGQNTAEAFLTTSNVTVSQFGKLFSQSVDGYIYAQPLYVANVSVAGKLHNVVYVATEHNTVYAFDADTASPSSLWQVNLGPSVPSDDICGGVAGCYEDLSPEIGITATPVIDSAASLIYVVAKNKDSDGSYHFRLHALSLTTGTEMAGGPVEITSPGFDPLQHLNRPALLLSQGVLYLAFGSVGDTSPYHGWIFAYDPGTLQQMSVFNASPSITGASFWAGGQGLVADGAGFLYGITANGYFNVNTGGQDYGDSFLKLNASTLSVADYFTPDNQAFLGGPTDVDLGSGGPLLIPGTTLLLGGGKDGILRLVDSKNMGKFNSTFNADVQEWQATTNMIMGAPVYWNSPTLGPVVYLFGQGDALKAWRFNGATFAVNPVSQSTITNASGTSNMGALSVSSNGSSAGTGIVWALSPLSGAANRGAVPGILRAFDASNLTHELWDSQQNAARDAMGNFAKFNPPTIANGKVYVPTFSGELTVYGLFAPSQFGISISPASVSVAPGAAARYSVSVISQNGFAGMVDLTCSGLPPGASCSLNPATVTLDSASVNSTLTVATSTSTPAATDVFTISGMAGSDQQTTSATLVVSGNAPDFLLSVAQNSLTVASGQSATVPVTLTSVNGFADVVSLACSGLPASTTCSLNPTSVNLQSGTATASLVIRSAATALYTPPGSGRNQFASWAGLLMAFTFIGFKPLTKQPRRKRKFVLFAFCALTLLPLIACGGGGTTASSPPPNGTAQTGTYNVTVTGTSKSVVHSSLITVVLK